MSDASTKQSVECPICGEEFDPTVAGGWCTNTECGEWQHTDDADEQDATSADEDEDRNASDVFAAPDDDAESDGVEAEESVTEDDDIDEWGVGDADDEVSAEADDGDAPAADDEAAVEETATGGSVEPVEADDEPDAGVSDTAEDGVEDDAEAEADAEADAADDEADDAAASTVDCPDCGVELEAEANFCVECGADVQDVTPDSGSPLEACPSCGVDVGDDDSFCVECGEDLDAHRGGDDPEPEPASDPDDAIEALGGDEDAVPESLVLRVDGNEITVEDGDKVGREIRAALMDSGRPEEEAVRIHREHVRFVRDSDGFYLVDLGDNPTTLNGKPLTKGDREAVAPGDELELSGVATVNVAAP